MVILVIPVITGILFINSDLALRGSTEHGFFPLSVPHCLHKLVLICEVSQLNNSIMNILDLCLGGGFMLLCIQLFCLITGSSCLANLFA